MTGGFLGGALLSGDGFPGGAIPKFEGEIGGRDDFFCRSRWSVTRSASPAGMYRRAIAANAQDANAWFNLGLLLRKAGTTTEGNAVVQIAVNLDSSLRTKAISEGVPLSGR